MLRMDVKTFNPEILYVFDTEMIGPNMSKNHFHDFFEMTIILAGESQYFIDGETYTLSKGAILLFNPAVEHYELLSEEMQNRQMHIGLRHFSIDRYPRNYFPLQTPVLQLEDYQEDFLHTCREIIQERREAKDGYDLLMKSLILKLLVLILRDPATMGLEDHSLLLGEEASERQRLVEEIKLYIEKHYQEELTLNQIAKDLYSSPATISRAFKEHLNETPINYLIRYRLEKAKTMMEVSQDLSVKEVAQLIGYEDAYHFSKLFKKYYGIPPSQFSQEGES